MDNNARARGFKRTVGQAKIPAESPIVMKRSASLTRGKNRIVQEDIVPAALAVLPLPVARPQEFQEPEVPPGQEQELSQEPQEPPQELQKQGITLEQLRALLGVSLAPINAAIASANTAMALLNAKMDNSRTRISNSRLLPHEEWIPLQREVAQAVADGPAPGALPPAGLLPVRSQTTVKMTAANLRELSAHYGVEFASWSAFEDFLRF